jgi:hypothetical protein
MPRSKAHEDAILRYSAALDVQKGLLDVLRAKYLNGTKEQQQNAFWNYVSSGEVVADALRVIAWHDMIEAGIDPVGRLT